MRRNEGMDTSAYLQRIGYSASTEANLETLEALAWAHLQSVPFENFDVHLGRRVKLDEESLFKKIVRRKRGGFCYELNGLFALLLRELGYQVDLLSARVFRKGKSGEKFDHMALRVHVGTRQYLVDVGFGDASTLPIELKAGARRSDRSNDFRLRECSGGTLFEMESVDGFVKGYTLDDEPREVQDFLAMCHFHQTSARSWFTSSRICVLHTAAGTRSLIEGRFNEAGHGAESVTDPGDMLRLLRERFDLDLPRMPGNKADTLALRTQSQVLAWRSRARRVWSIAERLAA
jgi:N-hydroxyarylamine O-acetyltransferase